MAEKKQKKHPKASSPQARETQLINLAYNLAEEQLREGTASPSIVSHFLKLSTQREELELDNLRSKAKLQEAKAQQIDTAKENEELTKAAIEAMKNYSGSNGTQ